MKLWHLIAGLGVALIALPAAASPGHAPTPKHGRQARLRELVQASGAGPQWADFLAAVAYTESKFNPSAANTSPGEASAARRSYDRNAARYADCGHPRSAYIFGSGGWFGFLPAVALHNVGPALRCLPPSSVHDEATSVVMALYFAKSLMRYKAFRERPQWVTIRAGWAGLGVMADPTLPRYAAMKRRFLKALRETGTAESFASARPPSLSDLPAPELLLARLQGIS